MGSIVKIAGVLSVAALAGCSSGGSGELPGARPEPVLVTSSDYLDEFDRLLDRIGTEQATDMANLPISGRATYYGLMAIEIGPSGLLFDGNGSPREYLGQAEIEVDFGGSRAAPTGTFDGTANRFIDPNSSVGASYDGRFDYSGTIQDGRLTGSLEGTVASLLGVDLTVSTGSSPSEFDGVVGGTNAGLVVIVGETRYTSSAGSDYFDYAIVSER